jgi:hypothetical protein
MLKPEKLLSLKIANNAANQPALKALILIIKSLLGYDGFADLATSNGTAPSRRAVR